MIITEDHSSKLSISRVIISTTTPLPLSELSKSVGINGSLISNSSTFRFSQAELFFTKPTSVLSFEFDNVQGHIDYRSNLNFRVSGRNGELHNMLSIDGKVEFDGNLSIMLNGGGTLSLKTGDFIDLLIAEEVVRPECCGAIDTALLNVWAELDLIPYLDHAGILYTDPELFVNGTYALKLNPNLFELSVVDNQFVRATYHGPTIVPEPASVLILSGLGLSLIRRRTS